MSDEHEIDEDDGPIWPPEAVEGVPEEEPWALRNLESACSDVREHMLQVIQMQKTLRKQVATLERQRWALVSQLQEVDAVLDGKSPKFIKDAETAVEAIVEIRKKPVETERWTDMYILYDLFRRAGVKVDVGSPPFPPTTKAHRYMRLATVGGLRLTLGFDTTGAFLPSVKEEVEHGEET